MAQYSAVEGCAGPWHLMHLGNLSISGAALVMIEATAVERDGRQSPADLGLWCDENERALQPILAFCRKYGSARIGLQLFHAGRKGSVSVAWERQRELPLSEGGWSTHSADAVAYPGRATPIALDKTMIKSVQASFAAAARRADRLGIDLIELHAAHGYLMHSFLSPLSNRRQDEYGGDLERRMRFVLEVFSAVRETLPAHKPMGVRLSATDWIEGGWSLDDSVALARRLKALGCDYITASSGGTGPEQKIIAKPGYQVPFAARIRQDSGIPTVAVGLITEPQQAEEVLASGSADLVALGRMMLYNPRWPWQAAEQLGASAAYPPQYERSHPSLRRADFFKLARPV